MRNFNKERRELLEKASRIFRFKYERLLKKLEMIEELGFVNGKTPSATVAGLVYAFKSKESYKIGTHFGVNPVTVRNNGNKIIEVLS